ncbi:helix-turn-helix transcriptional regulator [Fulvivirga sp. M361]|uniref:helix-turn-helix domain-containing protein n=1 Tax=Fulvivirga sp. M361 TaxID=2594266 RepID=UPI00117ACF1A|nr:AraC family transcriptional regulator [Fulvivirga sp. M361]TRX58665.1 helix-turn-helix transcriptional regulator [Fulvivirga sp. M361]
MSEIYIDRFYNHFSKNARVDHKPLTVGKSYLMRYNMVLPYSVSKDQNALSVVYSNSNSNSKIITPGASSRFGKNQYMVLNPGTDWELIGSQNERMDILSFILPEEITSKFYFGFDASEIQLLDSPFDHKSSSSFFVENIYNANYSVLGTLLQEIFSRSNSEEYHYSDPNEIVFELLDKLFTDQLEGLKKINSIKGKKKSTKKEVFKRLLIARDYIHDNFESHMICIQELSMACGLSEYHLYDSFKLIFQKTPHQYINQLRMQKAKEYCVLGKMSISDISGRLLFTDLASFSKLFKKTYGVPPSKFLEK